MQSDVGAEENSGSTNRFTLLGEEKERKKE